MDFNYIYYHLYLILFLSPIVVKCWPQRPIRNAALNVTTTTTTTSKPPIKNNANCNISFTSENRASRPFFPDPTDPTVSLELSSIERVIFPAGSTSNKIIFPTTHTVDIRGAESTIKPIYIPIVPNRTPSCAERSTFCIHSDNYPSAYVSNLLQNELFFKDYFSEDTIAKRFFEVSSKKESVIFDDFDVKEVNITQRIDFADDSPMCPSTEQVVYPKMALNKDDKWLYVVNQDQIVQGVKVEMCMPDGPCSVPGFGPGGSLPNGYVTKCKQKYIYRKFLSINDKGEAATDSFRIPSCCACYFKQSTTIGSRFGIDNDVSPVMRGRVNTQSTSNNKERISEINTSANEQSSENISTTIKSNTTTKISTKPRIKSA